MEDTADPEQHERTEFGRVGCEPYTHDPLERSMLRRALIQEGRDQMSGVPCQHIRAIGVERLTKPIGNVGSPALNQMREILADRLDH